MKKILLLLSIFCFSPAVFAYDDPSIYAGDTPQELKFILDGEFYSNGLGTKTKETDRPEYLINYHVETFGISEEQALERILIQSKLRAFMPEFEKYFSDRLAGRWIDNENYSFVYLLKGDAELPKWMHSIIIENSLPVVVKTGADYTKQELLDIYNNVIVDVIASFKDHLQGSGIDEKNNGFYFDFDGGENKTTFSRQDFLNQLYKNPSEDMLNFLNAPIQFNNNAGKTQRLTDRTPAPLVGVFPINEKTNIDYATSDLQKFPGGSPAKYTSQNYIDIFVVAFAIDSWTGARGFVSCAHCPNTGWMKDVKTGTSVFIESATNREFLDSERDYQYMWLEDRGIPTGWVYKDYAHNHTFSLKITGRYRKNQLVMGQTYCHNGNTTPHGCAHIINMNHAPSGDPKLCGSQTCAPTWIQTEVSRLSRDSCAPGDSGGPVYDYAIAVGVMSSATFDSAGGCHNWTFMALDYMLDDGYGVDILTES